MSPVSKSDILIASLGPRGSDYFVSVSSNKLDFSYTSARLVAERRKVVFIKRNRLALEHIDVLRLVSLRKKSLISYLALYITYLDPIEQAPDEDVYPWASDQKLRKDILEAFNDANLEWLRKRGYSISDLTAWRWILSARLSEVAIARLKVLANSHRNGFQAGRIPVFLMVFLLRRQHINDRALRMILTLIWDRLLEQDAFKENVRSDEITGISSTQASTQFDKHLYFHHGSIIVMVVRLLRHSREVWSAALPSISAIATKYLGSVRKTKDPLPDTIADPDHGRWAFLFNSLLRLLALPSSRHPFRSIIFHERAQFAIIRKMTQFEPALNISREGYRAVVQVQLAHRKTLPEREWARLKAKSWPPWKESKLGIDSDIGIERGISRAAEAITRSQEAGYAEQGWDSIAKIYAGWDTDQSPTIQTRAIVPRGDPSWQLPESSDAVKDDARLWYARITATRTVSEAWACFLAYRDKQNQLGGKYSQWPYFSMFEKLIFEEKKGHLNQMNSMDRQSEILKGDEYDLLPGDGNETWPNPGPQKTVYTRTSVPRSDAFLKTITEDGVVPGGRFLEFLLQHATNIHQGTMHLAASNLPLATRISFFKGITAAEMCGVNIRIFAAYMHCLCRHSLASPDLENYSQRAMAISHAFQLMDKRKPCYWPPWSSLMVALRSDGAVVDRTLYLRNALVQDALAWSVMLYWLNQMRDIGLDLQFDCFQSLCIGLEKSTLASRKLVRLLDRGAFVDDGGLEQFTPAGRKLREVLEQHTSNSVEKSTLAGWELLRGLPPRDFRRPGESHRSTFPKLLQIRPRNLARIRYNAEHVVTNGPEILKAYFEELVGVAKDSGPVISPKLKGECGESNFHSLTLLPKLLAVPHPVQLHAFIRVLGLHQDYDGILKVVQWMDRYADELHHQTRESMNGERAMRITMSAIRVFLEGTWTLDDDPEKNDSRHVDEATKAAPADTIQQAFETIDRQELWGGWASDDEVEFYIANGRRNTDYSDDCRRFELTCLDDSPKSRFKGFSKFYT